MEAVRMIGGIISPKVDVAGVVSSARKAYGLDDPRPVPYVIPTGSVQVDRATYIGGYPGGRIIEIYGPEHSGKTTLAMHACVEAQRMGLTFAYLDLETTLDLAYFRKMGVKGEPNIDWIHLQPETGEDAFSIIEDCISKGVKLVVVDSVAAMVPKAELEGEMGEAFMGLQARMMGQGMRKTAGPVNRSQSTVIFINQVRTKIGVQFGNPETTTGGAALKFYASLRLDIRQVGEEIKDGNDVQIGKYSRVSVKKNKLAPPGRSCMVPIVWGRGVAREYELLDELLLQGLVSKSSSYFNLPGGERVNGKRLALEWVSGHLGEAEALLASKRGSDGPKED